MGYEGYLAQIDMNKPAELGELGLKSIGEFGQLLSKQGAAAADTNKRLTQADEHFAQQQAMEAARLGEQQYQFDQSHALAQEQAARQAERDAQQSQINQQNLELNRMKLETEKQDFSNKDNINKYLSDPEKGKAFNEAVMSGDLTKIKEDPKNNAIFTSMLMSNDPGVKNIANQILTKSKDANKKSPYMLVSDDMLKTLENTNPSTYVKNMTAFIQQGRAKVNSGEITQSQLNDIVETFGKTVKQNMVVQNQERKLDQTDTKIANQQANAAANRTQITFQDKKTGQTLTQDGLASDIASGRPESDFTEIKYKGGNIVDFNTNTPKATKESAGDIMVAAIEKAKQNRVK